MTSSEREPRAVRVLACSAVPLLACTLLLTLSRGSILAAALGLVVLAVAAHPRALLSGLLAGGPATVVAVICAYRADLLVSADPFTHAARDQGATLALVVALCILGAALSRTLLLRLDDRLTGRGSRPSRSRWPPAPSPSTCRAGMTASSTPRRSPAPRTPTCGCA